LPIQWILSLGVSQFLGRISFPLYLVQFAVIVSLSANVIIWADANGTLTATTALLIAAGSVIASLALATLFLPIEVATLWLLRRIDRRRTIPRASVAVPAA
jgi:peptidoglycan/LPS O-acetylase OafA/YrhL